MTRPRDYYQVLGIARDTPPAAVRAAYARLARHHHPDTTGALPARLADVREAYRCLSDPAARAAHDQTLADAERAHLARQRALQRRLRQYDRRHPRDVPRVPLSVWRRTLAWVALPLVLARAIWRRNR